jgi:hypothetical protein
MNYTLSTPKQSKPKSLSKSKTSTTTWYSQTPLYILIKRKQVKKLPQDYPPHGSPNNHMETKSHGSPCDSTINDKEQIHMVPHVIPFNHKEQNHMVPHVIPQ